MHDSLTILIVDDDALDRAATRRGLLAGHPQIVLQEAATVAEALAALKADGAAFDCILLDYHLPDGTGADVIQEARRIGVPAPFVVLTGQGDEDIAVEMMKAGAQDYLSKRALTAENLWSRVQAAVRVCRAETHAATAARETRAALQRATFYSENSPLAAIEWTPDFRVLRWSGQAEILFGWTADEAVGRQTQDWRFFFEADLPAIRAVMEELKNGKGQSIVRSRIYRRDGLVLQCEWYNTALRDDAGEVTAILSLVQDITERLEAETEIRHSEERYRSLVQAMAQIAWTTSPEGEFIHPQPQWAAFTGQTEAELRGWGWLTAIHPEDQWETADRWAHALTTKQLGQLEMRLKRHDGVYRWMNVRAVPVIESSGRVREWVGVHTDITDEKEAQERLNLIAEASRLLTSSLNYQATLENVALAVVPTFADWCVVDLLDSEGLLQRIVRAHPDPEMVVVSRDFEQRFPIRQDAPNGSPAVARTGQSEVVSEITDDLLRANSLNEQHYEMLRQAGLKSYICVPLISRRRILGALTFVNGESGRRFKESDLEFAEEIARRAAQAVDNARLFYAAQAQAERESLINKIGRTLRRSLDTHEILAAATREVGEALLVSRCVWAWRDSDARALDVAPEQYVKPGCPPSRGRYPLPELPREMMALWAKGQPVIVSDMETDPRMGPLRRLSRGQNVVRAFISCPIFLRGEWVGVFSVQEADEERPWTGDEVELLMSVGDILALALENAMIYAREHRVADMLTTAFLPNVPEDLSGLHLATRYRAGLEEARVGGDLYDAFPLPDGRVALVIADVSGKGLGAAVQTATVKYSLRAFAAEAAAPSLVLRRLNRTLLSEVLGLGDHFVTLFFGVFDPDTGRLTYASAGHEAQIIRRADGSATTLNSNGPILGIGEHKYEQSVDYLHPGDTLFLFTDGLTEARALATRELLDLDRVLECVQGLDPSHGASALAIRLEDLALEWTGGRPQDDLALLVAHRPLPAAPVVTASEPDGEETLFHFAFPSSPEYAAEVRQAVTHWMGVLDFDRAATEDLLTAVTEAVTNAVRHGSPHGATDQFRVTGQRNTDGLFAVTVADDGPGLHPSRAQIEMPSPDALGGRGLPLMSLCADRVDYLPVEKGAAVRLTKRRPPNS